MPAASQPKPYKRFGTFGDPYRELTQAEREFYADLARIRSKRVRENKKKSAELEHGEGKRKRGSKDQMPREKSAGVLLAFPKRCLAPGANASSTAPSASSSPPHNSHLTVGAAVDPLDRAAQPACEPDRLKAPGHAASECVSIDLQHMSERRRGFGFSGQHTPAVLQKPGDSILLPSRYQSTSSSQEVTSYQQTPGQAPKDSRVCPGNSPDRTPDVPGEMDYLQTMERMSVCSEPQEGEQECSHHGDSKQRSVRSSGGNAEKAELSCVSNLMSGETAADENAARLRSARLPSLTGSTLQGDTAAVTPAHTPLSVSGAHAVRRAPPPHSLEQPLPPVRTSDSLRRFHEPSLDTKKKASFHQQAYESCQRRSASPRRVRNGRLLGLLACTCENKSRLDLAEKESMRGSQTSFRKNACTQTAAARSTTVPKEASHLYVGQCRRDELKVIKLIEGEQRPIDTAPQRVSAAGSSIVLSGMGTDANSPGEASSTKAAGVSAPSHYGVTSATISGASTEERANPRPSSADPGKQRCHLSLRNGRPTPLSCTDPNYRSTNEAIKAHSGLQLPTHAHPFTAGMAHDACALASESTPSAQSKVTVAGAGGNGGVSSRKAASMAAVTSPTPMCEVDVSHRLPLHLQPQGPEKVAYHTTNLCTLPSPLEDSQKSTRLIRFVDVSFSPGYGSNLSSLSVAEETVQGMVMAYSTTASPPTNTLHTNAGACGDLNPTHATYSGVPAESPSSPSSSQCAATGYAERCSSDNGFFWWLSEDHDGG